MARAPALQAGGQGFDSLILHSESKDSTFIDIIKEMRYGSYIWKCVRSCKKVEKGAWGMPRLLEAKKDVVSCDKLRGFANKI